jgi:hypothetical protein
MKSVCIGVIVAVAVLLSASPASAQAAGVAGNWKLSFQSDLGASDATLVLKETGGKVIGDITSDQGTVAVQGTFADNKLKLTMSVDACGQSFVITFNGVLEKDSMKGDADLGGFGTATWTATRSK